MTLTDCQLLSIVAQLGTFAAAAERLHITPSAVSHAVSGVEAECGFPLFTRTKSGVTLTAAAEKLMPAIQQMLASSESLDQSIAQINGMHKGALRLGVFNSACVTWLPKIVPGFRAAFPGIDVQIYQGSYDDITGWLKTGAVELGFLSNSSAHDLDFEPLYDDRLICIAPPDYQPRRPGVVRAEELRSQPFVSQQSDVDADIQSYFKKNDYLFTYFINRTESARNIKHRKVRHESYLRCGILDHKRNIPILTALQKLSVPSDRTVRIDLDLHLAIT